MKIGVILGSNSDIPTTLSFEPLTVLTPYGLIPLWQSQTSDCQLGVLLRHGPQHAYLPHLVNHRGMIYALKQWQADIIISFSVVGILNRTCPLAQPIVFDDVFFPSNQLPTGEACTFFDRPAQPGRGHFLVSNPLSLSLRHFLLKLIPNPISSGIYGHVFGPRFSTQIELKYLQSLGITAISQTSGPEFVLAGEFQIPYALIGFGVDYADPDPSCRSSVDELNQNLQAWSVLLPQLLQMFATTDWPLSITFDQGYLYQVESDLPS